MGNKKRYLSVLLIIVAVSFAVMRITFAQERKAVQVKQGELVNLLVRSIPSLGVKESDPTEKKVAVLNQTLGVKLDPTKPLTPAVLTDALLVAGRQSQAVPPGVDKAKFFTQLSGVPIPKEITPASFAAFSKERNLAGYFAPVEGVVAAGAAPYPEGENKPPETGPAETVSAIVPPTESAVLPPATTTAPTTVPPLEETVRPSTR